MRRRSLSIFPIVLVVHLALAMLAGDAQAQLETYTHALTQSTLDHLFWTTTPAERVLKDAPVPAAFASQVKVYAARNEFEPVQIVVKSLAPIATVAIEMGDFGSGITTRLYQVKYVDIAEATNFLGAIGDYPDPLWPLASSDTVLLPSGENTAFWVDIHVPPSTTPGDYAASLTIAGEAIPIELHVFDFVLPDAASVDSDLQFDFSSALSKYGVPGFGAEMWEFLDLWKQFFIDHRLVMRPMLWPGALTTQGGAPFIQYDCGLGTLTDVDGIWGFEQAAERYLGGTGLMSGTYTQLFNDGVGFPSFMAGQPGSNDPSVDGRPSSFCGSTRGASDWYTGNNPNSAYNQSWFGYIGDLRDYLAGLGYLDKAYFHFAGEAFTAAGYDAVAWYSRYLAASAPDLRLMVAEEAKPEIFLNANYVASGQIDIWLSYFGAFDPATAWDRDANHGEESWVYFLGQDTAPQLNPLVLDRSGMDAKLLAWYFWKYRIRGLSQYVTNYWSVNPWTSPTSLGHNGFGTLFYPPSEDGMPIAYLATENRPVPSMRVELIRDGFEDYEYLKALNGDADPAALMTNIADEQVDKLISSSSSIIRDSEYAYNLRRWIGMVVAGELSSVPSLYPTSTHPRAQGEPGNYYINFQAIAGEPLADPLLVDGHEYMKIDGADYDPTLGYGWYSPSDANWLTLYNSSAPVNELQRSALYSDFGRPATFEFDLPSGVYDVTVSVGRHNQIDLHQNIVIEGVPFVTDEGANPGFLVRTNRIEIKDSRLSLDMGIYLEYTMLNYLDIVGVSIPVAVDDGPPLRHDGYMLGDAVPNPFNPRTSITFGVPADGMVDLTIYDVAGRVVSTLISGRVLAGEHRVVWDGKDGRGTPVSSGVYYYRLHAEGFVDSKRMVLVR